MTNLQMLQRIAFQWGLRAFGVNHMWDDKVRALRFAEEAIELVQTTGVDKTKLHLLIDLVYERPPGNVTQEVGGVMVTLSVLSLILRPALKSAVGIDLEEAFLLEVERCLDKDPKVFAVRNQVKIDAGLT